MDQASETAFPLMDRAFETAFGLTGVLRLRLTRWGRWQARPAGNRQPQGQGRKLAKRRHDLPGNKAEEEGMT